MKNVIPKFLGALAFASVMLLNLNFEQSSYSISNISLSGLEAAIAATCESGDGDTCSCANSCVANDTGCKCL
ncbi:hypothetical protein C7460_11944 [Marinoscillum furvescens DSM 4134]|uniref:Uncharacterized protein n=1 Tax=Marinoscillum furvescens DSM 4134 TaxID=1122208 RepID=A0A3D9KZU4_MARFU|nr:hypothetical protein C7460_11944 [Marinoscillum furvescens DSM 4134]